MVTLKWCNVKVYVHCLSYFISVLQSEFLKEWFGTGFHILPMNSYISHLYVTISFPFLCSCGNFKDDSFSTHDDFRLWRNPVKFFHVQTAVTATSPKRNSHLLGHYNDSIFFFLRSKYFISGELAVIVIKMAGFMPCWLKYLRNECKPYRHFTKPIKHRCIFESNNKLNIYEVRICVVQDPVCVLTLLHKKSLTCTFLMTILKTLF